MTETRYLRKTWLALVVAMVALLLLVPCVCLAEGGKEQDEIDRVIIEKDLQWQTRDYGGQQFALGDIEDDGKPHLAVPERSSGSLSLMDMDLPTALDWRDNGGNYVSPVKNQGQCGSCWAFAVVGAMEARYAISATTPGSFLDLAEQHMVSCDSNNYGCSGGNSYRAAQFAQTSGVPDEACFPYVASEPPCEDGCDDWAARAVHVSEFEAVSRSVDALKEALQQGPFQVSFNVYGDFYSYGEGVYEYATGTYRGGHAVVLVGYQNTPGETGGGHFIVKNSWATGWGEDGYFRIGYSQVTNSINFGRSAYQYYMDMPEPDAYEPDDDAGSASQIVEGSAQQHSIVERGDIDWVYFDVVDEAKYVTLWTNGVEGGDTVLTLYNSSQQVLDSDDDGGQDYYSQITRWLNPGRYYASVQAYRSDVIISTYSIGMRSFTKQPAADINGDGRSDVVGFGNNGVLAALSTGSAFDAAEVWLGDFGVLAGGWTSYDRHPRTIADVNGDGLDDVVGFGNHGVLAALSNGSGFDAAELWLGDFGVAAGGWTSYDRHPRRAADVNGDSLDDVVGFGNNGVLVALSNGSGFGATELWLGDFGVAAGGWTSFDRHPRTVGDVNGDGLDDVVGFGNHGVLVALSNGSGFNAAELWLGDFGVVAGGWTSYDRHPRMVGDVNGDGLDDVVGFGNNGVLVALSNGSGFGAAELWLGDFGVVAGGWTSFDRHPRTVADVNGDGLDDVVGFGHNGVLVALSNGSGFDAAELWLDDFGVKAGGWTSFDLHPRNPGIS